MTASEKTPQSSNSTKSAFEILGRTFSLYRQHFNIYFGYAAWLFVPMVLVILAFVTLDTETFELVNILLSAFAVAILAIWVQIMSIQLTMVFEKKKTARMKYLSSSAWKLLVPFLLMSIITGGIVLLGFVALVIPGIIAGIFLIFATTIVVVEKKPIIASLKTSYKLARKNPWELCIKILIGYIAIFSLYALGMAGVYAIGWGASGIDVLSYLQSEPTLLEDLLLKSLNIILIPLIPIFHTLLYLDAKN